MKNATAITRSARCAVVLLSVTLLTACANMYVDGATREVSVTQFRKPKAIHPVQLLFEFQTKGVANAHAREFLKTKVADQVKESGLFSEVTEGPVADGVLLSIVLNNVPITDDAFSKGFVTGLTFGLAGSQVTDGYVCTARYVRGAGSQPIVKKALHAIHTTVGASEPPTNATPTANPQEAVTTMTHQIISNVLYALSQDPAFK